MLVETQATEVGPDSRCGTEARRALAGQLSRLEPVPLRVGTKRPDDPVYLPARAQFGDLPEAQERAVGVAAILPDGLDERQVLVRLVATAPHRPLHEHDHILQHSKSNVADVSPLHSRSKVRTYPQLAQVRGLQRVPRTKVAPNSGRMERAPLGVSPDASNPAVTSEARQGGDRSTNTDPELPVSYMLDPPISEPLITVRPRVATRRPNCCRKGLRTTPDKSAGQHRFWAGPYARFFGCGGVTTIDSQQTAGWPRAEPYPAHPQGSARRRGVLPRSTKSPAN